MSTGTFNLSPRGYPGEIPLDLILADETLIIAHQQLVIKSPVENQGEILIEDQGSLYLE